MLKIHWRQDGGTLACGQPNTGTRASTDMMHQVTCLSCASIIHGRDDVDSVRAWRRRRYRERRQRERNNVSRKGV